MRYYLLFILLILYSKNLLAFDNPTDTPSQTIAEQNLMVSMDFNQVPVRQVLQFLAQMHHFNLFISDNVSGNVTLHLKNLPWKNVLQIILEQQNLTVHYVNNVMIITSLAEWTKQQSVQLQAKQMQTENEPLRTLFISLHYNNAEKVRDLIKNNDAHLLSTRGSISADQRTNSLWIQDIPEKIIFLQKFIQHIDVPIQQILIEARLVNIDQKYEQELGIRLGLTRPNNQLSGSLNGANRLAQQTAASTINPLDRLNIDLPVAHNNAARIGLALVSLGGGTLLDLELSALATEGHGEIISSPRLITGNQQSATILSGQEIPYQQATTSGATSINFQKAVLNLTVTPRIISPHQLLLQLQLNQDHPTATLVRGVPTIETRQITTQVIVNNNHTIVLGGIYEQQQEQQQERIPFVSALPLIGHFFQHQLTRHHRRELLIFITPHLIPLSENFASNASSL